MAPSRKKTARRSGFRQPVSAPPSLPPQVLEQAAQGWLQSSGAAATGPRPSRTVSDHRLSEALANTLQELRAEIAELRTRLDRLESR